MRTSPALRAAALAATVTVLFPLAGCADGGDKEAADRPTNAPRAANAATGTPSGLASQKLTWKKCPAPSQAQGAANHRRRCRAGRTGSAPP